MIQPADAFFSIFPPPNHVDGTKRQPGTSVNVISSMPASRTDTLTPERGYNPGIPHGGGLTFSAKGLRFDFLKGPQFRGEVMG